MKDGSERSRAIRQDRHTMASIVMSYPVPRSAITTDEARAKYDAWERRNLAWLRDTYGDQLRVVMAHDDEGHGHLHAWLLPDDPGADATTLHPGKVAKRAAEAEAKAEGLVPREAVNLGNRALKAAMTEWQDTYYRAVGAPEGLTRTGPKRRRLTREQWNATKAAARVTAEVAQKAEAEAEAFRAASARRANIQRRWDARRAARIERRLGHADELEGVAAATVAEARAKVAALAEHREAEKTEAVLAVQREVDDLRETLAVETRDARADIKREREELDGRAAELDERESAIRQRIDDINPLVDRLERGMSVIRAGLRFVAEKFGVTISSKFEDALSDVQSALDDAAALRDEVVSQPKMRIAAASAAPEKPSEEADGLGF